MIRYLLPMVERGRPCFILRVYDVECECGADCRCSHLLFLFIWERRIKSREEGSRVVGGRPILPALSTPDALGGIDWGESNYLLTR